MLIVPDQSEWDLSKLPESRRRYLTDKCPFEKIVALIIAQPEVTKYWIERLRNPPRGCPTNYQQACFRLRVSAEAYDLFFNAPDGLRGRYWQSPDIGFLATRHLIDKLKLKLLAQNCSVLEGKGKKKAKTMTPDEVRASLDAPSAKVWVQDKDDVRGNIISIDTEKGLIVRRWKENEPTSPPEVKTLWRWTPCHNEIEVKGALIRNGGKEEHIPEIKQDRSCKIHLYGYA